MTLPATARFLIIRFSSLGDVVKCTALPRLIKARYPRSHVTFLTSGEYAELLRDNPHVDRVIGFPRRQGAAGVLRLAADLRRAGVDLAVDVHRSVRSRALCLLLGAPVTAYSKRTVQRWLLIRFGVNTYRPPLGKEHDFLAALAPFGVADDGRGTELFLGRVAAELERQGGLGEAARAIAAWRRAGRPVLGLAPVAAWALKRWPLASFRALAKGFIARGGAVVVFGGPGDADAAALAAEFPGAALSLVGLTSHLESAWFASLTDAVVANDTAMTHLAEAAGRDVITLYGPTSRELGYYPVRPGSAAVELPLPCRPCTRMGEGRCTHPHYLACLEGIEPAQVLERVLAMTGRPGGQRGAKGRAMQESRQGARNRPRQGARP